MNAEPNTYNKQLRKLKSDGVSMEKDEKKNGKEWKSKDLQKRTKHFALNILKLSKEIPDTPEGKVIKYQMVKSGTSTGANYRSAQRGKSNKDFIAKLEIAEEEADETVFWLEILYESGMLENGLLHELHDEGEQLVKISVASINTAKKRK